MSSVLQDWVQELSFMQQSVFIGAIRGEDGQLKEHPSKPIIRYLRRCVLLSAFDGKALWDPHEQGGGSFTGPLPFGQTLQTALQNFLNARDSMTLHYFMHFAHAAEIIGYHHPKASVNGPWLWFYFNCVNALHLYPESKEQLDLRLSDDREEWIKREKA